MKDFFICCVVLFVLTVVSLFAETCLNAHNIVREYHGAAPLEWDDDLAKAAKHWAEKLMQKDLLQNDPNLNKTGQGENVFMYYGPRSKKCADAVLQW